MKHLEHSHAISIWPREHAPKRLLDKIDSDDWDWVAVIPGALANSSLECTMPPRWIDTDFGPLGFQVLELDEDDGTTITYWNANG